MVVLQSNHHILKYWQLCNIHQKLWEPSNKEKDLSMTMESFNDASEQALFIDGAFELLYAT